jgi:hypothetical protein
MKKLVESFKKTKFFFYLKDVKERNKKGFKWIGYDGLINMESSALLTIFFMIFFPKFISMLLTALIVIGKCIIDKRNGHEQELHDFICAFVGIAFGAILGLMIA